MILSGTDNISSTGNTLKCHLIARGKMLSLLSRYFVLEVDLHFPCLKEKFKRKVFNGILQFQYILMKRDNFY